VHLPAVRTAILASARVSVTFSTTFSATFSGASTDPPTRVSAATPGGRVEADQPEGV